MEFLKTRVMVAQFMNSKSSGSHAKDGNSSCISEDCAHLISEYNCSCLKRSFPNRTCHETLDSDSTIPIVLWSISSFIVFLFVLELVCIRFDRSFMDNFFGKLIFSMGIVSSIVTQFCTVQYIQDDSDDIIVWYDIALGLVSILFVFYGYNFLFMKSQKNNIGSHDRGMGLVVFIISILLVGLEIWLIIMVYQREKPDADFFMYLIVYAVHKAVQAAVYIRIRRCKPYNEFKKGAIFYFKFLAFLNFTLWLHSIPFTGIQIYDEVSHSRYLQYVDQTFKALVIDYRLLCALLFLEHAIAIDGNTDENEHVPNRDYQEFEMPKFRKLYTVAGLAIGLGFWLLEIISSVQFWHESFPDVVNILPIAVDIGLAVLGYLFLKNVNKSVLHDKKVNLVLLMVSAMGATSIVYLFCFGILSLTSFRHDQPVSYVKWSACVYLAKASSLLVLLNVYTGISVGKMESRENRNMKNYILVSALCSGLFARFAGNIHDEFKGAMHDIAHHHLQSSKLRSLQDLFVIGPLFQLAASLHLALHFLLLLRRLHEQPRVVTEEDNSASVSSGARQFHTYGEEHAQRPSERSKLLSRD